MDYIVFLDKEAGELRDLLYGDKSMIIRGDTGRMAPYGAVGTGDVLYFINNDGEGIVKAKGEAVSVFISENLSRREELVDLILRNQSKLQLNLAQLKEWAGKKYIMLIEVTNVENVAPFRVDVRSQQPVNDWLSVVNINM